MHNDNVLAMRFTEQHITPAAVTLSAALFILHPSCSHYSVLSSPLFCFSLAPTHLSFTLSTQLSDFPRPHLSVISASLLLSLSFDSPLPRGYISLPLSLSSCSLWPLGIAETSINLSISTHEHTERRTACVVKTMQAV